METRTNLNDETIDKIQRLIQANLDSYKGFKEAANDVKNARLRELFSDIAMSRSRQAASLQTYVSWNNEEPEDDGTIRGDLHRAWLNVRSAINQGKEEVVLIEASRGEDHIKELYEDVLKDIPGNALSDVLHSQYAHVKKDYKRIESLKKAYN